MRFVREVLGRRWWRLALVGVATVAAGAMVVGSAGPAEAQQPQPTEPVPQCAVSVGEERFGAVFWFLITTANAATEFAEYGGITPTGTTDPLTIKKAHPELFETTTRYIPTNAPQWLRDELALDPPACYVAERTLVNACYLHGTEENHGARPGEAASGFATATGTSIFPEACFGDFPAAAYDLGFDDSDLTDFGSRILGTITLALFGMANGISHFAIWLVGWGFNFDLLDSLLGKDGSITPMIDQIDRNMVGVFGLRDLAWLVLIAWAGYMALKGRLTMVGGELLVSFVFVVLAAVLLADPQRYLVASVTATNQMAAAALTAWKADGNSPAEIDAVIYDVQSRMQATFVQDPYMVLNWGQTLTSPETADCRLRALRILSLGPHGSAAWPREYMRRSAEPACARAADFNARADTNRMVGALLTLGGSVLLAVLMGLLALTVLIAKIAVFGLFLLAPFAAVVAILPGAGRRLAWVWVASVGQTTLIVVGSGLLLSLLMIVQFRLSDAVGTVGEVGLVGRFASFDLVTFTAIVARRRFLGGLQSFTNQVSERMTRATPGGEATVSPLSPQSAGTNFGAIDRVAGRVAVGTFVPLGLKLNQRLATERSAKISARHGLENLWQVQRYQEQRDIGRVVMRPSFNQRFRPIPTQRWRKRVPTPIRRNIFRT